ncbi:MULTISPECIES: glycosyltransferase [Sphingomonas]|uniref:glycosyltransferase n=1 Tax=Sphingomonas TaxID=13687 RepID=UPI001269B621|nr:MULTISPECIES: glycosyltransferase [Sphingomonas]
MRILTFLHSFEPGGVERVALRLVRQWREMGVEAPLFIGREEGDLKAELARDLAFSTPARQIKGDRFETWWMLWQLPKVIRAHRPDVIFCAGNTYTVVAAVTKLLMSRRCPPIVTKVSNDLVLPGLPSWLVVLYRLWARTQAHFIEGWVVMHPAMRAEVSEYVDPASIWTVADPALTTAQVRQLRGWRPPSIDQAGKRFVALGRLAAQKNYPLMLQAFARGSGPNDRLTIFGDGPLRAELEMLVGELGLGTRVRFAGHLQDPWLCLKDQDVLLLSSAYEGIPAVLVEAMTCGMPIIATDCGEGVRGLLDGYDEVTLCPAGDVEAFSAAVRQRSKGSATRSAAAFDAESYTVEVGARHYLEAFAATAWPAQRAAGARSVGLQPSRIARTLPITHRADTDLTAVTND